MIAPQDYEVRQSGRVLELQSKDLWIRPTDLSWHYPILATIRELPFKICRGWSIANLEDKDEAKKQKILENRGSDQTHRDTAWQSHSHWQ